MTVVGWIALVALCLLCRMHAVISLKLLNCWDAKNARTAIDDVVKYSAVVLDCFIFCPLHTTMKSSMNFPIDDTLDLHTFRPEEVKDLVPEYLTACRESGIFLVRIIHGKGTGALRHTVQSILEKLPYVESFRTAEETGGGWGATIVILRNDPIRSFGAEESVKKLDFH